VFGGLQRNIAAGKSGNETVIVERESRLGGLMNVLKRSSGGAQLVISPSQTEELSFGANKSFPFDDAFEE
jgi:hypothetical protein